MKRHSTFLACLTLLAGALLISLPEYGQTFQRIYPTSVSQSLKDILPTEDGGFLIAGMTMNQVPGDTDIYLVKTNSTGDILWTKTFGGSLPDYPNTLLKTNDGNYLISGFTRSFGAGMSDIWLLKVDPAGNLIWSKTYGGTGADEGKGLILSADGNYILTGNYNGDAFLMKLDPAGNVLWTQFYGGAGYDSFAFVQECKSGGFILTGTTFSYGSGGSDIYLMRTDAAGGTQWYKTFGALLNEEGKSVLENPDGTFTLASSDSTAANDWDVHVRKVDASGGLIWDKVYGGNQKDVCKSMQPASDGGFIIASTCRSFGWINPYMWLVKIDAAGNMQWNQRFGSWYHNHSYMAKQFPDGGFIAVGHSRDSTFNTTRMMFVKTDASGAADVPQLAASDFSFTVYPNPADGKFRLLLPESAAARGLPAQVCIYNAVGKMVYAAAVSGNSSFVDLSDQPEGIYFVEILLGGERRTKRIILR